MRERTTTSGVMGTALAAGGAVLLALALLWQVSFVLRGAWPVTTLIFAGAITFTSGRRS